MKSGCVRAAEKSIVHDLLWLFSMVYKFKPAVSVVARTTAAEKGAVDQ
jgi:hypothetical protein